MTFTEVTFPAWVSPTLLTVALLSGLGVFRALFWDWLRRGRLQATRRCPRCWYDMTGAGLTCPECGKVAKRERDLRRSRRRWVWAAVLAVVGAGSLGARWVDGKSAREIAQGLPTDVLLVVVRQPASRVASQLGSANAPTFPFGVEAAAELWIRDWQGQLSVRQRRALAAMQFGRVPPVELTVRPKWPRGVPVTAYCSASFTGMRTRDLRAWSGWAGADVLAERAPRDLGDLQSMRRSFGDDWLVWMMPDNLPGRVPDLEVSLGIPPEGATEVSMEMTVREGDLELWTGRVTAPIQLVGTVDEAITAEVDATLTAAVEKAFREGFCVLEDGRSVEMPAVPVEIERVMVPVRVEVVKGGVVVAACSMVAGESALPRTQAMQAWESRGAPPVAFGTLEGPGVPFTPRTLAGATVRVRPDKELALRMVEWSRYWSGGVEVAVDAARRPPERRGRF